ncbi:F-box/WD repeat-containing protein 4 [Tachysurus ichikawai]
MGEEFIPAGHCRNTWALKPPHSWLFSSVSPIVCLTSTHNAGSGGGLEPHLPIPAVQEGSNPQLSSRSKPCTFVTGTACCENFAPLRIWDTERCDLVTCLGTKFRRGAGVLDIVYESPFQLLTCGYDTFIRYWDLRVCSRKSVMEWEEPHDNALYCMKTDNNYMIASGSSYYGVVRLWDKRQTRCLQMFQLTSTTSSPVYSLCFNATHLYAALDSALYSLDFRTSGPRLKR